MPSRPAIAAKCTMALVEPLIASSTVSAFSNACGVMIFAGVSPSFAIATARAPVASALRMRSAITAGIAAPPGSIMPSASVHSAIVLAVPITMQVPAVGANFSLTSLISCWSISPARNRPQKRRQSVHAPSRSPRWLPVSIGPVTSMIAGRLALAAPISNAGTVLSQPPISTVESTGCARIISSVSIAIMLRRYMLVGNANDSCSVMTGNSTGSPPASMTPRFTASINSGTVRWHALKPLNVFVMPMMGRSSASSV